MDFVHVFLPHEPFADWRAFHDLVHCAYTDEGEAVPSAFMREIGLQDYEPGGIECILASSPQPLAELLAGASYVEQWQTRLPASQPAASCAVCVFSPNVILRPQCSSWRYVGTFAYNPEAG